jgi:hypothetical protein
MCTAPGWAERGGAIGLRRSSTEKLLCASEEASWTVSILIQGFVAVDLMAGSRQAGRLEANQSVVVCEHYKHHVRDLFSGKECLARLEKERPSTRSDMPNTPATSCMYLIHTSCTHLQSTGHIRKPNPCNSRLCQMTIRAYRPTSSASDGDDRSTNT